MSMVMCLQATDDDAIDALMDDPESVEEVLDLDGDSATSTCDLDKAWHGLHYLLSGDASLEDRPTDDPLFFLIAGGAPIGDVDVGYGPVRAIRSEQTQRIAQALAAVSVDQLRSRFDPAKMTELDVYPNIWESEGMFAFDYVARFYPQLVKFVQRASADGRGLLVYLT